MVHEPQSSARNLRTPAKCSEISGDGNGNWTTGVESCELATATHDGLHRELVQLFVKTVRKNVYK